MRVRAVVGIVATAVTVVTALTLVTGTASAAPRADYPVSYGLAGLAAAGAAELTNPYGAPPGANDWTCKPSAAHPEPVVLVHGFSANMTDNWNTISPLLANAGYCVFALTYGVPAGTPFPLDQIGGRNAMEQSAADLGAFIDAVLNVTGASKVDIVGHSEGSLMPDYYVKFLGGAAKVDHYVGLTPLYHGTNLADLSDLYVLAQQFGLGGVVDSLVGAVAPAATEFLSGSSFIAKLNQGSAAVPGVTYTNVITRDDELVSPYTNGILDAPNSTNVVIQDMCPQDNAGHVMMAFDPNVAQVITNALDPGTAKPVTCSFVPPSP